MKWTALILLFFNLTYSFASEEVIRLSELRSKNLGKLALRYDHLLTTFQSLGARALCEANLQGRPLLEKSLKDDQELIKALRAGGDLEKEYAITLKENLASDFFAFFSLRDLCSSQGSFSAVSTTLGRSVQNTEYLALLHEMWLGAYTASRGQ